MRMRRIALPLFVFSFVLCCSAQNLPQGVQKKSSVAGITEYAYPNGLRVLLFPDSSSPKITVNINYLVGSRHEGYGETGMAHLLEHMDFIETTNGRQIKKEIVDHGAQWNGTTSYDRTNYYETFTAGEENLKWALGLEADRMVNVKMEKALLDTEMTVVRNEFERGENSPQRVLEERVVATAYLWHNYGKSTIGSREDIEKVPIDRLAAFYHKYYQPDNAVLVIAGQFDPAKALQFVAETVGKLPRPTRVLDRTYTVEPTQDGERYVELRRVGNGQDIIIAYHAPAAGHPDAAAIEVLAGVMGGGFGGGNGTGRLYKALVENKKALSASMSFRALYDPGFVLLSSSLSEDQSIDEVRKTLLKAVDDVQANPPSKEEVDRVKTRLLRRVEETMTDAQAVGMALTFPISQGDWRLMFLQHDQIDAVTPQDLVRVAKTYFKPANRTVGVFIPTSAPDRTLVAARPDLDSLLKDYKTSVTVARGEDFEPTPANIESRVVRAKLANGMKLVMLPKKTNGNRVSALVELRFGDERSLNGKAAVAQLTGALVGRSTRGKPRQQLQDAMDKLDARIIVSAGGAGGGGGGRGGRGGFGGPGSSIGSAVAFVDVKTENLAPALQLAAEMLKEPAFSAEEFEQAKQQRVKVLENPPTDPAQRAALELQRHFNTYAKGDPRYIALPQEMAEDLKKVTLDDVKKFYSDFYGASHGELVVLGPFEQPALQKTAGELLGSWNSRAPYQRLASNYKKVESLNQKIETPDKENAQFEAGMRLQMADADPDYPAMVLANYMFGGSITARMPNRIRNNEGLSYGASSRFSAPSEGDAALFSATVSSNPLNTPKVEASFKDELEKTLKNGFTFDEVAAAKKALLDQQMVGRSQDATLVRLLAQNELLDRTMKWNEQLEARIRALTADEVNAAFRRHVNMQALAIIKAGDFQRAGVFQTEGGGTEAAKPANQ